MAVDLDRKKAHRNRAVIQKKRIRMITIICIQVLSNSSSNNNNNNSNSSNNNNNSNNNSSRSPMAQ